MFKIDDFFKKLENEDVTIELLKYRSETDHVN